MNLSTVDYAGDVGLITQKNPIVVLVHGTVAND